ncbi:ATP binding [Branchiostoma belcheri]|nr:ATP binding [Branchiostoma belcheri]
MMKCQWWLQTVKGPSGIPKVGFLFEFEERSLLPDDYFEVKDISANADEPNQVTVRLNSDKSHRGDSFGSPKIVVMLADYIAPSNDAVWFTLENHTKNRDAFIEEFHKIQKRLRESEESLEVEDDVMKRNKDKSGKDEYDFNPSDPPESDKDDAREDEKDSMEDEEEEEDPKIVEDEGAIGWQRSKRPRPTYQRGKGRKTKQDHKNESLSDSSVEEEPVVKKSRSGKKVQLKGSFEDDVHQMRRLHPDKDKVDETTLLNKNAFGWRNAIARLKGESLRTISSNMPTHITVATLSPRCYQEAKGIMHKWSSGMCLGQGRSAVATQSIFRSLNGLHNERQIFDLLKKFHSGKINREKFEAEAKVNKKNNTNNCTAFQEERNERLQMEGKKKQLAEEIASMEARKTRLLADIALLEEKKKDQESRSSACCGYAFQCSGYEFQCCGYTFQCCGCEFQCCGCEFQCCGYTFQCCGYTFQCCGYTFQCCGYTFQCCGCEFQCCGCEFQCCGCEFQCCGYTFQCCGCEFQCCGCEFQCCGYTFQCCGYTFQCCGCEFQCCGYTFQCCGYTFQCCGCEFQCCGYTFQCCGCEFQCCGYTFQCCGFALPCCGSTEREGESKERYMGWSVV